MLIGLKHLIDTSMEITTTGIYQTWVNVPVITALIFGLAGGFLIAIYWLRRVKK